MKVKDIYKDMITKVFIVINQDDESELNWIIESTNFEILPEEENYYFVKAFEVSKNDTKHCFIGIMTPERIAEIIIKLDSDKQTIAESIYDQQHTIIPAIASDCFGDYELF